MVKEEDEIVGERRGKEGGGEERGGIISSCVLLFRPNCTCI